MEAFVEKADDYVKTRGTYEIIGKRVITPAGVVVGLVKEIRLNLETNECEGILVARRFKQPYYICKTYMDRITAKAVLLSIEPVTLLAGRAVISADGKRIGTVKSIERIGDANKVKSIVAGLGWRRTASIDASEIDKYGVSIILKSTFSDYKAATSDSGKQTR